MNTGKLVLTRSQVDIIEANFGHKEQYDFNSIPTKWGTAIRINPKQWMELKAQATKEAS